MREVEEPQMPEPQSPIAKVRVRVRVKVRALVHYTSP